MSSIAKQSAERIQRELQERGAYPVDDSDEQYVEGVIEEAIAAETARLRELVGRAVRGLKYVGTFRYKSGDDPHPLDCTLAGRVSRVFCTGMTRSIDLCREFGEDPEFRNVKE